ncbi:MAG TPA: GntR family transcriptional regulator [Actinomycetota bacterium]
MAVAPLRDQVYDDIKRRLLLGDFPLGIRLGEERLAGVAGVSRTPVREALVRLHTEGLVDRHPEGGYCPTVPDLAAIHDLYEVRMALEVAALRRPVDRGTTHDAIALESLRCEWRDLAEATPRPDPSFVLMDEDFHVRLAAASGNGALAGHLRLVNERIRIVRMHDFLTEERVERTITQHLGILDAVVDGDVPLAVRRFRRHLGESMAVVEDRAARALARMAVGEGAMRL